jgi:hypothetical protein
MVSIGLRKSFGMGSMEELQNLEFLTVRQVSELLQVSDETVLRRFGELPGVLDLGSEEKMHKRRYRVLRIPKATLERFIQQNQAA